MCVCVCVRTVVVQQVVVGDLFSSSRTSQSAENFPRLGPEPEWNRTCRARQNPVRVSRRFWTFLWVRTWTDSDPEPAAGKANTEEVRAGRTQRDTRRFWSAQTNSCWETSRTLILFTLNYKYVIIKQLDGAFNVFYLSKNPKFSQIQALKIWQSIVWYFYKNEQIFDNAGGSDCRDAVKYSVCEATGV